MSAIWKRSKKVINVNFCVPNCGHFQTNWLNFCPQLGYSHLCKQPKRQQKITLPEAHSKVTEFLTFLRRNTSRVLNLAVFGSFPDREICNMDRSPLALFGDQSKVNINNVNAPNEVEGRLNNKRFCTLILSVFGEDNSRVAPDLIFKGQERVSEQERKL